MTGSPMTAATSSTGRSEHALGADGAVLCAVVVAALGEDDRPAHTNVTAATPAVTTASAMSACIGRTPSQLRRRTQARYAATAERADACQRQCHDSGMAFRWSLDVDRARWLVSALHPFAQDVGSVIPDLFPAYARIFH